MAAQATHKESPLEPEEPPDILDLELEYTPEESLGTMEPEYTSEREPLAIREREYTSEPEEEEPRDILELEYTPEPELRDTLELEYASEQEEVELRDSGQRLGLDFTLEPESPDSGSPRSHGLGALLP